MCCTHKSDSLCCKDIRSVSVMRTVIRISVSLGDIRGLSQHQRIHCTQTYTVQMIKAFAHQSVFLKCHFFKFVINDWKQEYYDLSQYLEGLFCLSAPPILQSHQISTPTNTPASTFPHQAKPVPHQPVQFILLPAETSPWPDCVLCQHIVPVLFFYSRSLPVSFWILQVHQVYLRSG